MKLRYYILGMVVVMAAVSIGWAQTDSAQQPAGNSQQPSDNGQQSSNAPAGAFGQDTPSQPASTFPPLSGLDEAALEPAISARSFLVPGISVSEVADSNAGNTIHTGTSHFTGDTHVVGSLALQRMWKRYETTLDYKAGASFYAGHSVLPNSQVHDLNFISRVLWRTGSLQFRDCFNYLPEGIFGGGYGGVGALGRGVSGGGCGGGGGHLFGGSQLGSLGSSPRISNVSVVDIQNSITPRSAFTLAGGYSFSHFTSGSTSLIDSRQVTGQAGYDYVLSRRNTVAVSYAFRQFTFPSLGGGRFNDHVVQFLFGHQISGRMDLILGAGPQFIHFSVPATGLGSTSKISASGRASLRYKFKKAVLGVSYDRYESPGSGLFAGATSDVVHATLMHPLSRRWDLMTDVGYSHNTRLQQPSLSPLKAGSYDYSYIGGRLTHLFTRSFSGFAFYQFDTMHISNTVCLSANCGTLSDRHLLGVGLSWHPQAIRLD